MLVDSKVLTQLNSSTPQTCLLFCSPHLSQTCISSLRYLIAKFFFGWLPTCCHLFQECNNFYFFLPFCCPLLSVALQEIWRKFHRGYDRNLERIWIFWTICSCCWSCLPCHCAIKVLFPFSSANQSLFCVEVLHKSVQPHILCFLLL